MRKITMLLAGTLAAALPGLLMSQQGQASTAQRQQQAQQQQAQQQQQLQQQQQMQRMQQVQETMTHMERVMTQVHELNQWLQQHQTEHQSQQQQLRELGRGMGQAGAQLQQMLREMEQLNKDPTLQRDQDRLRATDRLHEQLRAMVRDLDEAQQALRAIASE
jgi:hypothetical protein